MNLNINNKILKTTLIVLVSIALILLISLASLFVYLSSKLNEKPSEFLSKISTAHQQSHQDLSLNLLILGYDYRQDQFETELNTDTIIFARYQTSDNSLKIIPLPRDLWDYGSNQKINRIYQQALSTKTPISQTKNEFSRLTGQKIDRILVLSTQNIIDITSIIGGVQLYLEKGFIDTQYPNQAYIDNPDSGAPIYQTVEFASGLINLDNSNVTQFIRSRKSTDDLDRINRQQLLIDAIIDKIKSADFLSRPPNLLSLYRYWQHSIQTDFSLQDLLNISFRLKTNLPNLSIFRQSLIIGNRPEEGDIYHPQSFTGGQWVFLPSDPDYSKLQLSISEFVSN